MGDKTGTRGGTTPGQEGGQTKGDKGQDKDTLESVLSVPLSPVSGFKRIREHEKESTSCECIIAAC
jgi:hypothetical protein